MSTDRYSSPLSERYASKEMQYIFSPDKKFRTWRRLWIALAESEKELGLNITDEQIEELKAHQDDINYEDAKRAFSSLSKEHKELKNMVDDMVDLIGCFSDEMKADIILVAMLICAVDGKISQREKNWIKKLIK